MDFKNRPVCGSEMHSEILVPEHSLETRISLLLALVFRLFVERWPFSRDYLLMGMMAFYTSFR